MLNFLCFFVLLNIVKTDKKNNIAPYGENFYYLTYQDKIQNLEGYILKSFLPLKEFGMDFRFSCKRRFTMCALGLDRV